MFRSIISRNSVSSTSGLKRTPSMKSDSKKPSASSRGTTRRICLTSNCGPYRSCSEKMPSILKNWPGFQFLSQSSKCGPSPQTMKLAIRLASRKRQVKKGLPLLVEERERSASKAKNVPRSPGFSSESRTILARGCADMGHTPSTLHGGSLCDQGDHVTGLEAGVDIHDRNI